MQYSEITNDMKLFCDGHIKCIFFNFKTISYKSDCKIKR